MTGSSSRLIDCDSLRERANDLVGAAKSADRWERAFRISIVTLGLFSLAGVFFARTACLTQRTRHIPKLVYPLGTGAFVSAGLLGWSQFKAKGINKRRKFLDSDFSELKGDDKEEAKEAAEELFAEFGESLPHLLKHCDAKEFDQDALSEMVGRAASDAKTHRVAKGELKRAAYISCGVLGLAAGALAVALATRRARLYDLSLILGSALVSACAAGYLVSKGHTAKRKAQHTREMLHRVSPVLQDDFDEFKEWLESAGPEMTELKVTVPVVTFDELDACIELCPHLKELTIKGLVLPIGEPPALKELKLKSFRVKGLARWPLADLADLPDSLKRLELPRYAPKGELAPLTKMKIKELSLGAVNDEGLRHIFCLSDLRKLEIKDLDGLGDEGIVYDLPRNVDKLSLPRLPALAAEADDPLAGVSKLHLTHPDRSSIAAIKRLVRLRRVKFDDGTALSEERDLKWMQEPPRLLDEMKVKGFYRSGLDVKALKAVHGDCVFLISGRERPLKEDELHLALKKKRGRIVTIKRLHPYK